MTIEKMLRGSILHKPYISLRTSKVVTSILNIECRMVWRRRIWDAIRIIPYPRLWALHRHLLKQLDRQQKQWAYMSYACGYFY